MKPASGVRRISAVLCSHFGRALLRMIHLPANESGGATYSAGRKHILFVTNMWPDELRPYYGSFVASQAKSLADQGAIVDVLFVRGFVSIFAYVRAIFAIPRVAKSGEYDVIHLHYGHIALAAIFLRGRPTIVSYCGEDLLGAPRNRGNSFKSRLEVMVFRQLSRIFDGSITKSTEMEAVLPSGMRQRNYVLPNGVDLSVFKPTDRRQARAKLGWEHDRKVCLFLGNPDDPRKNVELAKKTVKRLNAESLDVTLHIAWKVRPEDVPVLMNASNCLLFPSLSEGSPNAVKEAMACALPIVASPVGDIPERFQGVKGCWIARHDLEEFSRATKLALEIDRAPEAREAVQPLSIEHVGQKLLAIYDQL